MTSENKRTAFSEYKLVLRKHTIILTVSDEYEGKIEKQMDFYIILQNQFNMIPFKNTLHYLATRTNWLVT